MTYCGDDPSKIECYKNVSEELHNAVFNNTNNWYIGLTEPEADAGARKLASHVYEDVKHTADSVRIEILRLCLGELLKRCIELSTAKDFGVNINKRNIESLFVDNEDTIYVVSVDVLKLMNTLNGFTRINSPGGLFPVGTYFGSEVYCDELAAKDYVLKIKNWDKTPFIKYCLVGTSSSFRVRYKKDHLISWTTLDNVKFYKVNIEE